MKLTIRAALCAAFAFLLAGCAHGPAGLAGGTTADDKAVAGLEYAVAGVTLLAEAVAPKITPARAAQGAVIGDKLCAARGPMFAAFDVGAAATAESQAAGAIAFALQLRPLLSPVRLEAAAGRPTVDQAIEILASAAGATPQLLALAAEAREVLREDDPITLAERIAALRAANDAACPRALAALRARAGA